MDTPLYEPPMFVSSTNRITCLHYTYRILTLSPEYVCKVYLQNHLVTLLFVCLELPRESLAYTTLICLQF